MQCNKSAARHQPGDQGQPYCLGCKQRLKFGTDHSGGTIQWCKCGEFPLATIRLPAPDQTRDSTGHILEHHRKSMREHMRKKRKGRGEPRDCLKYLNRGKPDKRPHGDFA